MPQLASTYNWEELFNAIGQPAFLLDKDHRVLAANSESSRLTGLTTTEIVGKHCYEIFHRDGSEAPVGGCPLQKMLQTGRMESNDIEVQALDAVFMVTCTPIFAEDGTIDKVIHIATDITERKRAESILLEQKQYIDSLIQFSTTATFVIDPDHRVVVWNKACEQLTGYTSDGMLGSNRHWQAFYPKKQATLADIVLDRDFGRLPPPYSNTPQTSPGPTGYRKEGWFENVGGKDRYLVMEAAPIFNRQNEVVSIIETISDLTESKALEEQLLHAQKMESIGHLAGGIAHEFNNILAVILGYGQVLHNSLKSGTGTAPAMLSDLNQILTAGERASALTKGLLAFSRKQHVSMKKLDINLLVHNTLKSFSRIIGDDILIRENLETTPLHIHADQTQIMQVLMNLMTNARDAMPQGGELVISTRRTVLTEVLTTPFCTIPPGRYAQVSLADTGRGIDPDAAHMIFEPFYTTKEVGKGTGLGLAVVYGIVAQHGGYVSASPAHGQGTVFDLYFTLIEEQPAQQAEGLSPLLRGGNETILFADDEPTLLSLFSSILTELGYRVIPAVDGVDAVEKFISNKDDIQLLVFDVQMRGKSGLQAYKEIKEIKPESRVLFISGFNAGQFTGGLELEIGSELLYKPFRLNDLADKVRRLLDMPPATAVKS